jgi:glycosyltransferase involved in cell wall biosynthesis
MGNSAPVVEDLKAEGIPEHKLSLIYNGVCVPAPPAPRNREEDPILVVVANLIPYKGHEDLLQALAPLSHLKWRLWCVGEDRGIQAHLEKHAQELGIGNRVTFLGLRHDVPAILAQSHIGVVSSHEEGFSNALLEEMAAGLPVVATQVGGNQEALGPDYDPNLMVPPHNPQALGAAIERLLTDPDLAQKWGAANRHRVTQHFSQEACLEGYVKVLKLHTKNVAQA